MVYRRAQAPHHQGEQYPDDGDGDRDHGGEVAVGDAADVVDGRGRPPRLVRGAMVRATAPASARTAGTAFIAAVVDGSPALSPVRNCTAWLSGLMYRAVARHTGSRWPGCSRPGVE